MYKYILTLLIISIAFVNTNAQYRKIPAEVTDAFSAKYSNAKGVEWKDRLSSFQAEFKIGETGMKASFSNKGEWLQTETKLIYKELPLAVRDSFAKSKYADIPVKDIVKTEDKTRPVQYKITVMKGTLNKTSLIFSNIGELLSIKNFL